MPARELLLRRQPRRSAAPFAGHFKRQVNKPQCNAATVEEVLHAARRKHLEMLKEMADMHSAAQKSFTFVSMTRMQLCDTVDYSLGVGEPSVHARVAPGPDLAPSAAPYAGAATASAEDCSDADPASASDEQSYEELMGGAGGPSPLTSPGAAGLPRLHQLLAAHARAASAGQATVVSVTVRVGSYTAAGTRPGNL
jgi:hypothetical protein